MFTEYQKQMIIDALNMALISNKRMQTSKPKFKELFDQIARDLEELKLEVGKIKTTDTQKNK